MGPMPILNVGGVIIRCWMKAEEAVCKNLPRDSDEEHITNLFRGELEKELEKASNSGGVEAAFVRDLQKSFPDFDVHEMRTKIARRLVATVAFHPKQVEGKTGGDLGIVLVRPDVQESFGWSQVTVKGDYRRGLLCQAKLLRGDSSWGTLTKAQEKNLPDKLKYSGLLLYKYLDEARRKLHPFEWQLTSGTSIADVIQWLRSGIFPSLKKSREVLDALVKGRIGTDVPEVIERDITPPLKRTSLTIRVHWKDDSAPPTAVYLRKKTQTLTQEHIVQSQ
jgi:hypothetical protein